MQRQTTEIQVLEALRNARDYFDQSNIVYSSKKNGFTDPNTGFVFTSADDLLNSLHEFGIQGKTLKEAGFELEEWYELLKQQQETTTEIPEYKEQTTTVGDLDQLKNLQEQAEKRAQQKADIEAREKQTIEDFIEKYQKKIEEVQTAQSEFEDKVVYAKIEVDPKDNIKPEQLETEQQKKIEHYEELIKQEKFETAKQELAAEIVQKAEKELLKQGITKEEIKNVARETASEAIEILSHKNEDTYTPPTYQTIILATVATDTTILPKIVSSKAVELVKSSANNVSVFRIQPEVLTRSILTTAFGDQFTTVVLGVDPSKIKVSITNTLPQYLEKDQLVEYREVRLSEVNNHQIDVYQGKINVLNAISDKGREITTGYVQSNITGFLSRKIEALPAGSVIKKLTSTPEMQAVLFAKFGVGNPVTWQYANPVLMRVMGQNQLAGAFFSTVSKVTSKPIVTAISGKLAGQVASKVATQAAGKATGAGLGATIGAITGLTGGPLAIVTAAVGAAIGELISKAQIWFKKNEDKIKPILAGLVTLGAIRFLGVGPGLGVGAFATFGLMGTAGLSAIALGGVRFLGLIGRSVGIAIATPVIVTLLVLPPLVAFIMLVINNSAYVVPPGLKNSSTGGGIVSPYIDIKKTASPTGPFENSDLPLKINYSITIGAKKGTLSNIKVKDTCKVISKNSTDCPQIDIDTFPTSVAPGSPKTITYTSTFDSSFKDSVIINTISISADTDDQKGVAAEASASITIGNPPISCPLPGGFPDNQMNYSYNGSNDTGHGSTAYWGTGNKYYFPMPQSTSCFKPTDCPYYGYSYDVFPSGTTDIFAPSVLGKDVAWNCSYAFSNGGGSAGHTYKCKSSDGNYLLVLTHMQNGAKTGEIKSGEKIGVLYNQGGNTHLHLEFQLGGQWQKPENYFCK